MKNVETLEKQKRSSNDINENQNDGEENLII
jgi:hypothetical protein